VAVSKPRVFRWSNSCIALKVCQPDITVIWPVLYSLDRDRFEPLALLGSEEELFEIIR
jgi:hypothetical protein